MFFFFFTFPVDFNKLCNFIINKMSRSDQELNKIVNNLFDPIVSKLCILKIIMYIFEWDDIKKLHKIGSIKCNNKFIKRRLIIDNKVSGDKLLRIRRWDGELILNKYFLGDFSDIVKPVKYLFLFKWL